MIYHLFAGYNYYPGSGLDDYIGPYDTVEDAENKGKSLVFADFKEADWYEIIYQAESGRLTLHSHEWRR